MLVLNSGGMAGAKVAGADIPARKHGSDQIGQNFGRGTRQIAAAPAGVTVIVQAVDDDEIARPDEAEDMVQKTSSEVGAVGTSVLVKGAGRPSLSPIV
jgi:hypothetical protein